MQESTLTSKGQTTLPKAVRRALDLQPGDRLCYLVGEGGVRIVKSRPLMELAGVLQRPGQRALTLEEMDAAIAVGAIAGSTSDA